MRVAIIGAGAAGLSSARHVVAGGHWCEVLEQAPKSGGTWLYTDDVDDDKYGFPVYSAMYKGLRTNLPKEVMGFPDFPIPEHNKSYLKQEEILQYLNLYVKNFDLINNITFNRYVIKVHPLPNHKWKITSIDKPTKTTIIQTYDSIMICNGHYSEAWVPKLKGIERFRGVKYHSKRYRSAEGFAGRRVLVIGAGPSGMDLALQISKVAAKVVLSHRSKDLIATPYPSNVELKTDVIEVLNGDDVEFLDGSIRKFDAILYCTGYKYSFPFLDESCGVTVTENHIEPLYKHMVHIEKPTMCFIGIPFNVCAFQMFDLQARYYVSYLNGTMHLPTSENMIKDVNADMQIRWKKGYTKKQAHLLGPDQSSYYTDLAEAANLKSIAPVIVKLRDESVKRLYDNLMHFREDRYEIISETSYIKLI